MEKFLSKEDLVRARVEHGMIFDASPTYGIGGVLPAIATTLVYPKTIPQVLAALNFEKIAQPILSGDFEDTHVLFKRLNLSGETRPYTDWSYDGSSDVNLTFLGRNVYRAQTNINGGDLEIAMAARSGLYQEDIMADKVASASYSLAKLINKVGFLGINGQNTYGLLNDPSLAPVVQLKAGASGSTLWANKTPQEIIRDILGTMYGDIVSRAGGNINVGDTSLRWILVVAPAVSIYLATPNVQFVNETPLSYIQKTFPNLEVVTAPEYQVGDGTTGNYAQLILADWQGTPTVFNLMTYRYMSHGLIRDLSGFKGKSSCGTAGAGVVYPMFISTSLGS